jgi:uncharacterized repeat protein (TIGR03803 family)
MSARHLLHAAFLLLAQPAAASTLTTLYNFHTGMPGVGPYGQIVRDRSGAIYGIVSDAPYGNGAVYEITPRTGKAAILWHFAPGPVGFYPAPGLTQGVGRTFFGATDANRNGENYGSGAVFSLSVTKKTGTATAISDFNSRMSPGEYPDGSVNVAPNGDVFAITSSGGTDQGGYGAIIRFSPRTGGHAGYKQDLLYSFTGQADGFYPEQHMLLSRSGALYGTALASSNGQVFPTPVFQLAPPKHANGAWAFSLIWQFPDTDCADGPVQMIEGPDGTIYSPCSDNIGKDGNAPGNIFSLTPPAQGKTAWTKQVLWKFHGRKDGGHPHTGLVLDAHGNLYGTTSQGNGTIFRLTPPVSGKGHWTETTLWTFSGADGNAPSSPLVLTPAGTLIGTTSAGGTSNGGTLFELTP